MAKPPVLIVDDSPINLKVARVALEADGYEVRTAENGEEAWRLLGTFKPSSILMDLQLPGLDGFALTKRIKSDPALQHIPIIAVTAYAMKGDRERALAVGCDDYISKPVDPILLPALVATHIKQPNRPVLRRSDDETAQIVVIEDNATTRKLIRVALESDGFRVWETGEAKEALRYLEEHVPLLVLQDLMLPDMDGLELVRRLRAMPHGRGLPILCLSGFLSRMDDAKAMAHSFSALLVKSIDPVRLIDVVRRQLALPAPERTVPDGAGPRVLIVDDDPLLRRLAEFQLTGAGMRVTAVASGKQALAEAERARPDAIASDVLMPDMDGFELCLALRQHQALASVPVVLVSSHYTERADHKLAERVGASALVQRTGDWASVIEQLRSALARESPCEPAKDVEGARDAILRRTQGQLERQLAVNRRLGQQGMFHSAQLSVLARVTDALTHHAKLDEVLGEALSVCLDLAGISKGVLYLSRGGSLVPTHRFGFGESDSELLATFFGHAALLREIVAEGHVCAVPSTVLPAARSLDFLRRAGVRAALIVPVVWSERTYGALLLGARTAELTGREAVTFARVLGGQLGQAIGLADAFEQLHASEERFRALVDAMDDVTVVDRDQRITGVFGRRFEREPDARDAMLGKTLQEIMPHDRPIHDDAHTRALLGESVMYEWSVSSEPDARHYQSAVFPVLDAQRVTSIVRVGRDVTEQKHLQTQIMVSDRMASVGMLAAGVAHEINSPLMAVLGNLQLSLESVAPGHERDQSAPTGRDDLLREALEAARRVEAIVRDLRLFSRTEERSSSVDVHDVLDSTLRMARNEIRHRARLVRDLGQIPKVRANPSRLGQVFLNLLLNAAQAIPDGRADENEIRIATRLDAQDRVIVEISDTGPGIPLELRARLFTPFVTTKPAGLGTGLGLAICQRIVISLGGAISFESALPRGTVFRVQLPADRESERRAPTVSLEHAPPRRHGRVLVIDDDAALCTLIRKSLSREHDVVCTTDAREALQIVSSGESFDLILCDVMMPHMTGAEFYRELERARPELSPRTAFLTGGAFTAGAREFVKRLGTKCLEKPFELSALRKFVNDRME
jgi:CheY-like chemotaxis protein